MFNIKAYISTKIIQAMPLEREGRAGYRVRYPDGYVSWLPKETLEDAYREISPKEIKLIKE